MKDNICKSQFSNENLEINDQQEFEDFKNKEITKFQQEQQDNTVVDNEDVVDDVVDNEDEDIFDNLMKDKILESQFSSSMDKIGNKEFDEVVVDEITKFQQEQHNTVVKEVVDEVVDDEVEDIFDNLMKDKILESQFSSSMDKIENKEFDEVVVDEITKFRRKKMQVNKKPKSEESKKPKPEKSKKVK
jgi:hypothetical protein